MSVWPPLIPLPANRKPGHSQSSLARECLSIVFQYGIQGLDFMRYYKRCVSDRYRRLDVISSFVFIFATVGCVQAEGELANATVESKSTSSKNNTSEQSKDMPSIIKTMTAAEAIQSAANDIGFSVVRGQSFAKAEKVTFSGESLPFLKMRLNGRETWRIEFNDVKLDRDSGNDKLRNPFIQKLIVFLCPESGTTIKIVSSWPSTEPRLPSYPSCTDQEQQLRANSIVFTGLPKGPARISFCKAIESTDSYSPQTKQLLAYRVMESHMDGESREVWAIHLRGIPSPAFSGPIGADLALVPECATNHLREVIDAESGKWIYATSTPQPSGWLEDRF